MFDFEAIYNSIADENSGQKKLDINSVLSVYYGFSPEGYYRLSFLSKTAPPAMMSTKLLRVVQGREKSEMYWTCFDLINIEIKKVFYTFCTNLIESIDSIDDESIALKQLWKRYAAWRSLFQKELKDTVPLEVVQGLFGELYFFRKYMAIQYGINKAVASWTGPEGKSKDYSVGQTWYEIKTVGAKASEVKISSIAQLDSDFDGKLVIIKAESMSKEFSNGESSIGELLFEILKDITDPEVENSFLTKFSTYGIDLSDECMDRKFDVKSNGMNFYTVNDSFPKITSKTVPYSEVTGVEYTLSISGIEGFKEK